MSLINSSILYFFPLYLTFNLFLLFLTKIFPNILTCSLFHLTGLYFNFKIIKISFPDRLDIYINLIIFKLTTF